MIIIKNIFLFFRLLKANIQMAFLCLSFVIFANLFAIYFISHEQYIYYWDWAHYWKMYIHLNELFIDNPLKALYFLNHSIRHDDYNPLPILPLIPFAWLFGTSRLTYILTITNISLLPSAFMMALFAQRIFVQQFLKPAILPLAIAGASILALHPLWIPVLRGFPDILGLLVINIILLRIFSQPFYQQKIKYLITTGVSLCLLVLLRRWYTFWVVAFFPALVISQCIYFYQQDMAWRYYVLVIRNATIIGLTFTISLFVFATPFMIRIIHTDYADLYSAYKTGLSTFDTAFTVLPYFGCITIALAIMGLVWLVVQKNTRIIGGFLLIQAFIVIYLFARTQNFGVQHYYLLLTSIAIGITTLIMNLLIYIKNKGLKIFLIGSVFTILIIQSISIFFPNMYLITEIMGRFAPTYYRCYPFIRHDINVISHLWDKLDTLELEQRGNIYVLASADILNDDILKTACQFDDNKRNFCNYVFNTHHVDKIYGFPRQPLMDATYLVIASPTQYHLNPEDQRIISIPIREVINNNGIGTSFQRISGEFTLDKGVKVFLYKKIKPISESDMNALLDEFFGYYPQMQH